LLLGIALDNLRMPSLTTLSILSTCPLALGLIADIDLCLTPKLHNI
jgi:hypothetical protein